MENCYRNNVIIIDDDPLVTSSISRYLGLHDLHCKTFSSANNAIEYIHQYKNILQTPSCIICDIKMKGMTGLQFQEELISSKIEIPFILMSGANDIKDVIQGFRKGAVDFLLKPIDPPTLHEATEKALTHHCASLMSNTYKSSLEQRLATLTPREREVAHLVAKGHTNLSISLRLNIALRTVKLHRHRALKKLGVSGIVELVKLSEHIAL
jgi:FixJ family two-component response regulator